MASPDSTGSAMGFMLSKICQSQGERVMRALTRAGLMIGFGVFLLMPLDAAAMQIFVKTLTGKTITL
ncbi:MAG: hypothetical protein CME46_04530, partial [Halieaceae bacterium]|nr:hypothetical protein [Halieaceae bacterium]